MASTFLGKFSYASIISLLPWTDAATYKNRPSTYCTEAIFLLYSRFSPLHLLPVAVDVGDDDLHDDNEGDGEDDGCAVA